MVIQPMNKLQINELYGLTSKFMVQVQHVQVQHELYGLTSKFMVEVQHVNKSNVF